MHARANVLELDSISGSTNQNSFLIFKHCYCWILLEKCNEKKFFQVVRNHFEKQLKVHSKNGSCETIFVEKYLTESAKQKKTATATNYEGQTCFLDIF